LTSLFSDSNFLKKLEEHKHYENNTMTEHKKNTNLLDYVLNDLKYKNMGGIRLEAKGRLTRRFTASRSVFKIK
jgi:hypothetical protein